VTHPDTDARLLLLAPEDTVLVARTAVAAGERLLIEGHLAHVDAAIGMGHKLARRAIVYDSPIIKYGAVIGTATQAIAAGAHVHLHNVKSNYTATHSLDAPTKEPT
jgi:hypothetical protein